MELVSVSASQNILARKWMVIYTRPRWEKKVNQLLQTQDIVSYCPVKKVEHVWSDRKKIVEIPLFSSYVFVKINMREQSKVRQTLGVINFVYHQGKPAIVDEKVIDEVKHFIQLCPDMEVVNLKDVSVGDRVKIKSGVFVNKTGKLIEIQGKHVLMSLDNLGCLLIAKVPANNIVTA